MAARIRPKPRSESSKLLWLSVNEIFDPKRAICILSAKLTGNQVTKALKRERGKLWFEAFMAWIIGNDDQGFIRDSVVRRVAGKIGGWHTEITQDYPVGESVVIL